MDAAGFLSSILRRMSRPIPIRDRRVIALVRRVFVNAGILSNRDSEGACWDANVLRAWSSNVVSIRVGHGILLLAVVYNVKIGRKFLRLRNGFVVWNVIRVVVVVVNVVLCRRNFDVSVDSNGHALLQTVPE